ncbi:hypothetical protein ATE67_06140 [Sphingopyxis sp. H050]|jgi:hypothetical protein|uniref:hypothetical protein n=1 Tax=Sphingopyxis sp. H050 TaxID=1759072 RepID=UPI0007364EE6|nr:hypothetical protein [Sphingopyxis sp. H050]KTE22189.1 hypothetical protein ATE67_06140 [Sphingopyxis sp. H050]
MDAEDQIDIRHRLRAHAARQLTIARMNAPDDWRAELRAMLQAERVAKPLLARGSDMRLFAESFAIFFVATMMFLI